jgi:hypothetical protein
LCRRTQAGPIVGGAERLSFDVLNGRMTVSEAASSIQDESIISDRHVCDGDLRKVRP